MTMLVLSTLIYRVPALLMALTVHEYAHGAMSASLGDPTPEAQGRLTMNPLAHLDIFGTIMLVLVGFGWAKPVEVDPRYYKHPREDFMKVALAGPAANLLLCFLSFFIASVLAKFVAPRVGIRSFIGVATFLRWLALYNVWFAFFNLIPIPPLDGYNVLRRFLPYEKAVAYESFIGRYSTLILIVLCFTGIIGMILQPLASLYVELCYVIIDLIL
jgi:Zn-dependent protease